MRLAASLAQGCALAILLAAPALAQDGAPLRERTGPGAQPPVVPGYAVPGNPPAPAPPPAAVIAPGSPAVMMRDVAVTAEGDGAPLPQRGWAPAADEGTGLRLVHTPGQPLDAAWVRAQFAANGMIGAATDYSRVIALTQLINRAYLANGYANSGVLVAPQAVFADVLALRLILGGVSADGVTIAWRDGRKAGLNEAFVLGRMPSATSRPFNAFALERDFRSLADDPAIRTIDAALRPGARPGEASLALTVDPARRADLYFTVANNRSPAVGGVRYSGGAALRNIIQPGDVISAEYGRTDGLDDALAGYTGPLFGRNTDLVLRAAFNNAAVVEPVLLPLDIRSREWSVEGGIAHRLSSRPLIPRGSGWQSAQTLTAGALVVHRKTKTRLLGAPFSFSPGAVNGRAEYTALRLTQDFVQRGVRHVLALSLTETVGLEGTRSTVPGALSPAKHYVAVLGQASFARRLTERLEFSLRAAGQWSSGTLYSGERFSAGGENSVRGYRENLLLADRGLFGSAELGYQFSLSGAKPGARRFDWGAFRVGAFADGALTDNARAPEPFPRKLASIGGSLAWRPSEALLAKVTYGHALRDASFTGKRNLQDRGVQFRVTLRPLLLF